MYYLWSEKTVKTLWHFQDYRICIKEKKGFLMKHLLNLSFNLVEIELFFLIQKSN